MLTPKETVHFPEVTVPWPSERSVFYGSLLFLRGMVVDSTVTASHWSSGDGLGTASSSGRSPQGFVRTDTPFFLFFLLVCSAGG